MVMENSGKKCCTGIKNVTCVAATAALILGLPAAEYTMKEHNNVPQGANEHPVHKNRPVQPNMIKISMSTIVSTSTFIQAHSTDGAWTIIS